MKTIIVSLLIILSLGTVTMQSCSRTADMMQPADAGIGFYNASQLLNSELEGKNPYFPGHPAIILINQPVPVKPDTLPVLEKKDYAFFGVSVGGQQMYPMVNISQPAIPWMGYMRYQPGAMDVHFLGTDTSLLAGTKVNIGRDERFSVFLIDSLGKYSTIVAKDIFPENSQGPGIRFVHAASDTGALRISVDQQWIDETFHFGTASGFYKYTMADSLESQIFRIQLSPASDTSRVITKYILKARRGELYTFIADGYFDYHEETEWVAPVFNFVSVRNK